MAEADIPSAEDSIKQTVSLVLSPFEHWGAHRGYDIAPAVLPGENRLYADAQMQSAYEAWNAGAASASRDIMRSMVDGISVEELAAAGIV
jgi:hypothetical protein